MLISDRQARRHQRCGGSMQTTLRLNKSRKAVRSIKLRSRTGATWRGTYVMSCSCASGRLRPWESDISCYQKVRDTHGPCRDRFQNRYGVQFESSGRSQARLFSCQRLLCISRRLHARFNYTTRTMDHPEVQRLETTPMEPRPESPRFAADAISSVPRLHSLDLGHGRVQIKLRQNALYNEQLLQAPIAGRS